MADRPHIIDGKKVIATFFVSENCSKKYFCENISKCSDSESEENERGRDFDFFNNQFEHDWKFGGFDQGWSGKFDKKNISERGFLISKIVFFLIPFLYELWQKNNKNKKIYKTSSLLDHLIIYLWISVLNVIYNLLNVEYQNLTFLDKNRRFLWLKFKL